MVRNSAIYSTWLLLGDILVLIGSLWLALFIRLGQAPAKSVFELHFYPFAYIILIWILIYFIYDLYRPQASFFQTKLLAVLFNIQIFNSLIAITFFYLIPYFGITPKTNLFIFIILSFILLVLWRVYLAPKLLQNKLESLLFACGGEEVSELSDYFNQHTGHNIQVCGVVDNTEDLRQRFPQASLVAISTYNQNSQTLPEWYAWLFAGTKFVSVESMYENLFGRIPLSLISERWFLEHVSGEDKPLYDFIKRFIDLVFGVVLGLISLVFYPFIFLLIWLDDGRPFFFVQERVGREGVVFKMYKFRSMRDGQVTKFGAWLRASRLDELPQLFNLIRGDLSLVGPRPELPDYVNKYRLVVPYYDIRHLIAPGLSGWAQIYQENHPHFAPEIDATREKLSYDLYYIKNRSLVLDLTILLKTIRILLSRSGR